jgi:hypothetical protein
LALEPAASYQPEGEHSEPEEGEVNAVALEPVHGGGDGTIAALTSEATPNSESPPNRRALVAVIPAALLVLVALWEIVTIVRAGHDTGSEPEWDRAAAAVRAEHKPGDLIVFAPRWIDPVGREHLGDLIPVKMAARMDGARYGTIWELSIRGARAPETRGLEAQSTRHFGAVTVRRFVRDPAVVVYDFVDELPRATITGAIARRPAAVLEEVGFEPHRCVRGVPRPGGTISVVYPAARLGSKLVGYVGLADVFTRREIRTPGRLRVLIGGKLVAEATAGVDDGWVRFEADTRPAAAAPVEFQLTAVGPRSANRLVCFAAEARQ